MKKIDELTFLVIALRQQQIIAYPTESVFGFGCDPDSENAVKKLLFVKKRSWKKGLILVAANYSQLHYYIDDSKLDYNTMKKVFSSWPGPFTWIMPARKTTPYWLTGIYSSLAVRVSAFEPIRKLCIAFNKPVVSSSANISGYTPARTYDEVKKNFGNFFLIMNESVENRSKPSEIRDARNGKLIRAS